MKVSTVVGSQGNWAIAEQITLRLSTPLSCSSPAAVLTATQRSDPTGMMWCQPIANQLDLFSIKLETPGNDRRQHVQCDITRSSRGANAAIGTYHWFYFKLSRPFKLRKYCNIISNKWYHHSPAGLPGTVVRTILLTVAGCGFAAVLRMSQCARTPIARGPRGIANCDLSGAQLNGLSLWGMDFFKSRYSEAYQILCSDTAVAYICA
jgi:hypothetical protein